MWANGNTTPLKARAREELNGRYSPAHADAMRPAGADLTKEWSYNSARYADLRVARSLLKRPCRRHASTFAEEAADLIHI